MTGLEHSVDMRPRTRRGWRLFGFLGPAAMVGVGYMDPGNWATNLQGGAQFGYGLLWVLLVANGIAMLMQCLAAQLGIVSGLDLAQACRRHFSTRMTIVLWIACEIAIIACDLAEVLGSAVALQLLFGIPPAIGAALTGFDVLLILALQRYGVRKLEAVVAAMVLTIGVCMVLEVALSQPAWPRLVAGLVPHIDRASLYVAIGILGATVMPHNLYLHSALVRTRRIGADDVAKKEAIRFNRIDTGIALNIALFVNVSFLILAAETFHPRGIEVTSLSQTYELLAPLLGTTIAPLAFAIALLAAGQSSTITGTLAGQVVMEGFVDLKMSPFKRRLTTRLLALGPAVGLLWVMGEDGVLRALVLSQVVLSLQLPFAVIPLIRFTNAHRIMGRFASPAWMGRIAWAAALAIIAMNLWFASQSLDDFAGWAPWLAAATLAYVAALAWVTLVPLRFARPDDAPSIGAGVPVAADPMP